MKRVVIAGTESGVGKTTIATGLMAALTAAGYNVQPFKVGPDYIDPGFHSLVTGNYSRNLDSYFMGEDGVKEVFLQWAKQANISIIEGVMGLFDGKGKEGVSSTASIAKTLQAPVILIIDGEKLAQSGAALAYGYKNFDPELDVRGVILNNIAGPGHYRLIKEAIEEGTGLKVVGYLPASKKLKLPERHLGLVPTHESAELTSYFRELTAATNENIDLDMIIELAAGADPDLSLSKKSIFPAVESKYQVRLGVAYDQAFNFYYRDNLDILEMLGAELIYFSPMSEKRLSDVDGLYIGGGFPESFLKELAANSSMQEDIYNQIEKGLPVYAECGGYMYLTRGISNYSMVGIIPTETLLENQLQAIGYVEFKALKDTILMKEGQIARGHVYHYSRMKELEGENFCYQIIDGVDRKLKTGYSYKNMLASYVHLHFGYNSSIPENFLKSCLEYKNTGCR